VSPGSCPWRRRHQGLPRAARGWVVSTSERSPSRIGRREPRPRSCSRSGQRTSTAGGRQPCLQASAGDAGIPL